MGRTNPTYRDLVRATERDWSDFRRALRRPDRPHFDRLFEHARAHADAAGYRNATVPAVPILLSVALEHEKALAEQGEAVADQKRRLAALEGRVAALDDGGDPDVGGNGSGAGDVDGDVNGGTDGGVDGGVDREADGDGDGPRSG